MQVRQLSKIGENAGTIAFYFALTSTVFGSFSLLWGWKMPTPTQWICLIAIGFIGGIAQVFMTLAYQYAEASAIAPYDYLSILWAVIIGTIAFSEIPDITF